MFGVNKLCPILKEIIVPAQSALIPGHMILVLEVGDDDEETNVLPRASLHRQMFSDMVANGDGDLSLHGLNSH